MVDLLEEGDLAAKVVNEVVEILNKYLIDQPDDERMYVHIALSAYVMGWQLCVTEQEEVQQVMDTVCLYAKKISDQLIEEIN